MKNRDFECFLRRQNTFKALNMTGFNVQKKNMKSKKINPL